MKVMLLLLILFSSNSWAYWKVTGEVQLNGQVIKVDQKIDHNKVYTFSAGKAIFRLKMSSEKIANDSHFVDIAFLEKRNTSVRKVNEGKFSIYDGGSIEIENIDVRTKDETILQIKFNNI